jgi:DnaJ-class molecular chaperone
VCASCHGYGLAETSRTVALKIAAGARTGERYQIDLRCAGIENLVLDVTIFVA